MRSLVAGSNSQRARKPPLSVMAASDVGSDYSAGRELLMDVMHYGSGTEIVEPASLREQARSLLVLALSNYEG